MSQRLLIVSVILLGVVPAVKQSGAVEPATKPTAQVPTTQRVLFARQTEPPSWSDVRVTIDSVPPNREGLILHTKAMGNRPHSVVLYTRFDVREFAGDLLRVDDVHEIGGVTFVWTSSNSGVVLYLVIPERGEAQPVVVPIPVWRAEQVKDRDSISGLSVQPTAVQEHDGTRWYSVRIGDLTRARMLLSGRVVVEWDSLGKLKNARFERDAEGK